MTFELSGMKIITVLAMIYKVFCMMGGDWKKKDAIIVIILKTMAPMFISTMLHS